MLWVSSQRPAVSFSSTFFQSSEFPINIFFFLIWDTLYDAVQLLAHTWPTKVGWIEFSLNFHG